MPTARMNKADKKKLNSTLEDICNRLKYLTTDPISEIGMSRDDFYKTLVPNDLCKALGLVYTATKDHRGDSDTLATTKFQQFHIAKQYNNKLTFRCNVEGEWYCLPQRMMWVRETHPLHNRLLKYGNEHVDMSNRVRNAQVTIRHIVYNCSSVGQIQRVIPNIMDFVPSNLSSTLVNAERRSPVPALDTECKASPQRVEEAIVILAFGTLKPDIDNRDRSMCITVGEHSVR